MSKTTPEMVALALAKKLIVELQNRIVDLTSKYPTYVSRNEWLLTKDKIDLVLKTITKLEET